VLPCWNVVRGFDLVSGKSLWSFDLIPGAEQFGSETWTGPDGANAWGGLAFRPWLAYIATGSPHPNYLACITAATTCSPTAWWR
jgi:hypothetical protein